MLISILFYFLVYAFIFFFYRKLYFSVHNNDDNKNNTNLYNYQTNISVIFYLLGAIFVQYFIKLETFINFWDFAGYWNGTNYFQSIAFDDLKGSLGYLYNTINNDEYNATPCFFLAPLLKLFGTSFQDYILSIYLLFLGPFLIVCNRFIAFVLSSLQLMNKWNLFVINFATFFFPALYIPTLHGYLDSIGLFFLIPLVYFTFNERFSDKISISVILTTSLLIFFTAISRRWYGFWIVSFFFCVGVYGINYLIKKEFNKFKFFATNIFFSGLTSVSALFFIFPVFFERTFLKNYIDIYSAYRSGTIFSNFLQVLSYHSVIISLLGFGGFLVLLMNNKTKIFSIFLFSVFCLSSYLFIRVNSFGTHQYLLLSIPFIIFLSLGIAKINQYIGAKYIILALLLLNFQKVFLFQPLDIKILDFLLSDFRSAPRIRTDVDEIKNLINYSNKVSQNGKRIVYCLASSTTLNDDLLRNVTNNQGIKYKIEGLLPPNYHSHVDKRDPFPKGIFMADIVCVPNPPQFHLNPEGQQVVGYFSNLILNDPVFSRKFRYLQSFSLENNVEVKIMERIGPFFPNEVDEMVNYFKNKYPDYPNSYTLNYFPALLSNFIISDGYSYIQVENNFGGIVMHPSMNFPTSFDIGVGSQLDSIRFQAFIADKYRLKDQKKFEEGEVGLKIYGDTTLIKEMYINWEKDPITTIKTKKYKTLRFVLDKGKYLDYADKIYLNEFTFYQNGIPKK